jgi:hypothetical protein
MPRIAPVPSVNATASVMAFLLKGDCIFYADRFPISYLQYCHSIGRMAPSIQNIITMLVFKYQGKKRLRERDWPELSSR